MKLTVLGSGTMISPVHRNPAGYLLEQNEEFLLLDMGPGIIRQLKLLQIDLLKIKFVLISHFHQDHCSDLFAFLMNRFLLSEKSNAELTIFGPHTLNEWFESQAKWQGAWLFNAMPTLLPFQNKPLQVGNWQIQAMLNGHTQNSLSIRISNDKTIFYSGDTDYNETLVPLASQSDLAIIECSLPDHLKVSGHLTPTEVAMFASKANLKRILVTHIYPQNDSPDLAKRIKHQFDGEVIIASDFLTIFL